MRGLLILAVFSLHAQNSVEFTGRYWLPQMHTTIRVESSGFGTDIDARRDLGIPDTNFPQGGVTWSHGSMRLQFEYTPMDYSGDQIVSRTILFRGQSYTVGTRVLSDLEIRHLQLNWAWQFGIHEGMIRIGPMVEADGFLLRGSLAAPQLATPFQQTESLSVGVPAAGLALDIRPHRSVDLYGEAAGMQVGSYGSFVGSDFGVKVYPQKHLLVTAGYRTFNLHVENSPDFAHFRLGGAFVGAGFRW